jgi:putative hydrolase of the HAD superfamily
MPKLPPAILFDLDDTILSAYSRPEAAWMAVSVELADLIAPLTPAETAAAITQAARRFWADPDDHRVWRQQIREARRQIVAGAMASLSEAGKPVFTPAVAARLADRFTDYRDEQMHLFPGAHHTIDTLRAAGVRLGLITNGDGPGQRVKIERFDLARRFNHIQIEGEAGFGKPEPQAYHHALSALGVGAGDLWIVGDNLEWEVAAPQRLGIHAVWCDHAGAGLPPGSTVRPDRIINALPQLLDDL